MNFWEFREPGSRDSRRFVCLISIKFFSFITERIFLGLNNATLQVVTILVTMASNFGADDLICKKVSLNQKSWLPNGDREKTLM